MKKLLLSAGEKESKTLFFIVVLNITLQKYFKDENMMSSSTTESSTSNDIESSLFSIAISFLNKESTNYKVVLFYVTKMLVLLLKKMKDIDNYFNIEKYIAKIATVDSLTQEEKFVFVKEHLVALGDCFSKTKAVAIPKESQKILIDYYVDAYSSLGDFIAEKFETIKKIFLDSTSMFSHLKNATTLTSLKADAVDEVDVVSKSQQFIALCDINASLFAFLVVVIKDVVIGKSVWNAIDAAFNAPQKEKIKEIILLSMLEKCKIRLNVNKTVITAMFEFISEKIIKDTTAVCYYDILLEFCELIITDDVLSERCMMLFAQIVIEDIGPRSTFIDKLTGMLMKAKCPCKLVLMLLRNISGLLGLVEENRRRVQIVEEMGGISEKFTVDVEAEKKEKIEKEEFIAVMKDLTMGVSSSEVIVNCFIKFFNFIEGNFYFCDISGDYQMRKSIYGTIVNYIYEEFLRLGKTDAAKRVTSLIGILNYFITQNKLKFEDSYTIYKILSLSFKRVSKDIDIVDKSLSSLSSLYVITMSVLTIIKNVYKLPSSLTKIDSEITAAIGIFSQLNVEKLQSIYNTEAFYPYIADMLTQGSSRAISIEEMKRLLDVIYSKVFGVISSMSTFFESQLKTMNVSAKELDVGEITKKESDMITEGNVTTYGDMLRDDINDISIHFTDDIKKLSTEQREKNKERSEDEEIKTSLRSNENKKFVIENDFDENYSDALSNVKI